eukprot:Gb_34638 [translate_table: standard]
MDSLEVKKCLDVPPERAFGSMGRQDSMRYDIADMDATSAEDSKDDADSNNFLVRRPSICPVNEGEYSREHGNELIETKCSRESKVDADGSHFPGMEHEESAGRNLGNSSPVVDEVIDVSDKEWTFPLLDQFTSMEAEAVNRVNGLYVYNNVFTLIPESVSQFKSMKTLKVFSNEVNLFSSEVGDLVELENLQVKVSSSGLGSLPPLQKLKTLKELELCKMPPRPSAFSLSSEISNLRSLTRLSVCHFSISFLPSEIGCLKKLEELDLSFNKLKTLPNDIADLMALRTLKVASNKLVELPFGLSSLSNLATIDVSNNRLTSLHSLKLFSMRALRALNAQHNKLRGTCHIPAWISCNLEGNDSLGKDIAGYELISSSSEEEVSDSNIHKKNANHILEENSKTSSVSPPFENGSTIRCAVPFRSRKGWRRRDNQQQKARQERLNNSRKSRHEDHQERVKVGLAVDSIVESSSLLNGGIYHQHETVKAGIKHPCKEKELNSLAEDVSSTGRDLHEDGDKNATEIESASPVRKQKGEGRVSAENSHDGKPLYCCNNDTPETSKVITDNRSDGNQSNASVDIPKESGRISDNSCSEPSEDAFLKPGRRQGRCINNPKPSKRRRSVDEFSKVSQKYCSESFCSVSDHLPDGFYDAGRDRPFKPLRNFEKESLCLDSREVILVDRERDEELDVIALSAQQLISGFKQPRQGTEEKNSRIDNFHRASLLALFVSDCFGGSDKSLNVSNMRRAVVGANVGTPFVCSCAVGSNSNVIVSSEQTLNSTTIPGVSILCEKSVRIIKEQRKSNIVPIGALHYGVCRHRAILLKILLFLASLSGVLWTTCHMPGILFLSIDVVSGYGCLLMLVVLLT